MAASLMLYSGEGPPRCEFEFACPAISSYVIEAISVDSIACGWLSSRMITEVGIEQGKQSFGFPFPGKENGRASIEAIDFPLDDRTKIFVKFDAVVAACNVKLIFAKKSGAPLVCWIEKEALEQECLRVPRESQFNFSVREDEPDRVYLECK